MLAIGKWIVVALAASMSGLIGRVLLAMGIGYATYEFAMPAFVNMIRGQLSGLPGTMIAVLAAAKVDVAITILFSAISARMASRIIFRKV
jgi:hypothetical protein